MRKLFSRRPAAKAEPASIMETLEPRIVLDGTPDDASNPVVEVATNVGNIYIELFPDVTPITVDNFLGYVSRGDYDGTFFHRHVNNFVLQGGGWTFDEVRQDVDHITQQDQIQNEFELSNVRWTVAMAKLGGDPDSATSEWFINLSDNSSNLDNQNGGFTVFGEVVGGRDVVETITDFRIANLGNGFETVPVTNQFDPQRDFLRDEDLIMVESARLVYDPDQSLLVESTVTPSGVANGSNVTTVVIESQFDRAIAFRQIGLTGGWTVTDLNLKTSTPGETSSPVTWIDPKDNATYAAAVSEDGLLLYKHTQGSNWTVRNLNSEVQGVEAITSSLTVFVSQGRKVHLMGLSADGDAILFNQTGATSNGQYVWTGRNVSETDLADAGLQTPDFTSPLSSYVTSWNGLNVVGLDANGDIQALWWAPGRDGWSVSNLSNITGAPAMQGAVAPYLTSWNAVNLTGVDADGNVIVTWWVPSFGGDWVTSDLTALRAGPALEPGSVSTYVTSWGGTNIVGRDSDGNVAAYWWAPTLGPGQWNTVILSDFIAGAEVPTGPMVGFSSPSGVVNIFGAADDGELIRYWWRPGEDWQWQNVSAVADLA